MVATRNIIKDQGQEQTSPDSIMSDTGKNVNAKRIQLISSLSFEGTKERSNDIVKEFETDTTIDVVAAFSGKAPSNVRQVTTQIEDAKEVEAKKSKMTRVVFTTLLAATAPSNKEEAVSQ